MSHGKCSVIVSVKDAVRKRQVVDKNGIRSFTNKWTERYLLFASFAVKKLLF